MTRPLQEIRAPFLCHEPECPETTYWDADFCFVHLHRKASYRNKTYAQYRADRNAYWKKKNPH